MVYAKYIVWTVVTLQEFLMKKKTKRIYTNKLKTLTSKSSYNKGNSHKTHNNSQMLR